MLLSTGATVTGNAALLRRAAAAPLLLAEPEAFWPDLAAERLRQRGRPVAYIYAELLQKRRWKLCLGWWIFFDPIFAVFLRSPVG